jgi:predicted nuclease with TOPRIM domain
MNAVRDDEADSLASLEAQIVRAVEVVSVLRQEKESLARKLEEAEAEKDAALQRAAEAGARADRVTQELESLRAERKQVRTRIEKLKDQLELLGGN